jgi:large subunit ribosomal protein L19
LESIDRESSPIMTNALMASLQPEAKEGFPQLHPGDTVRVHQRIVEGRNERIQVFQGVVIALRGGTNPGATYTVRRTAAHGIGVERTFPLYSKNVEKVEVLRKAKVRRAQLYFLRSRSGKAARLREKRFLQV